MHVDVGFVLAGLKNINKLTTGLKIGAGILAAVVVAVLIWLYYLSYKKHEQAEKEKSESALIKIKSPKRLKANQINNKRRLLGVSFYYFAAAKQKSSRRKSPTA